MQYTLIINNLKKVIKRSIHYEENFKTNQYDLSKSVDVGCS